MEVKNCAVTQSDTTITKLYGKQKDGTYHTGVDITAASVYSICNCVVTDISKEPSGTYIITCQYDDERSIRYGNLASVDVSIGQLVRYKSLIGQASVHTHFEYLERNASNLFPVRIGRQTYFKVDPIDVIANDRTKALGDYAKQDYMLDTHPNPAHLSREMLDESIGGWDP